MNTQELKALGIEETQQHYADCKVFRDIESKKYMLFKELSTDWKLDYVVDSFSKDLLDNIIKWKNV